MGGMAFREQYADLKRRLAARPGALGRVLSRSGVDRSTWTRWGQGQSPRVITWEVVVREAEKELADA